MSDFEEKDTLANAAFDAFMSEQHLMIEDEDSRELFFQVFLGGMNFMLKQFVAEFGQGMRE